MRARMAGRARSVALVLGLLPAQARDAAAQHPLNLGFERDGIAGPAQPWGWRGLSFAPGATASVDSAVAFEGARSFRISWPAGDDTPSDADASHTLMYWIPPLEAAGREARLAGRVRSAGLEGVATVTIQSWAAGAFRSDTARTIGPADDDGWVPVEAAVRVDSAAHSLVVTVGLSGTGAAWFDGLAVAVAGRRLVDPAVVEGPPAAGLAWLDERAHAIATVDAPEIRGSAGAGDSRATRAADAEPDADLVPLTRIVGDARVVALGEATHGTSEFFRAKHRLTRYLVERLGFRVFLIEANQLPVERINEYVHGAPGEARDVMRTMFAVWNTEEVRDLIEWMRAYNARHPDRSVSFVGFDMQDPSAPVDSLESTLRKLAPDLADTVRALHADFREAWRAGPYPRAPEDVRRAWMEDAEEAWRLVAAARRRLTEAAGDVGHRAAIEWVVQNANVVRQAAHSAFTQELPTRDSAMASNILWTLDRRFPGARAVVWAHDAHISRGEDGTYDYYSGGSMGGVLARALGDDYRAIGLLTFRGSYTGYVGSETLDVPLFPGPVGSLEDALHRIAEARGEPLLLADLRDATPDDAGAWLLEPRPIRLLGFAAEDWGFAYPIVVGRQFDAVLFVDESTPSRMLRRTSGTREGNEASTDTARLGGPDTGADFERVLDLIRMRSVHRANVDWSRIEAEFRSGLDAAGTLSDSLAVFRAVFEAMDDVHSSVVYRGEQAMYFRPATSEEAARVGPLVERAGARRGSAEGRLLERDVGYLVIPSMNASGSDDMIRLANHIRDVLCRLASEGARRWIVDLRLNMGGSMHPMLTGLGPLIGDGPIGGIVSADRDTMATWSIDGGANHTNGEPMVTGSLTSCGIDPDARVAVLLGPVTMSSGQIVAVAFEGRAGTRSFGQSTADGYTTANEWIPLAPDLALNLAVGFIIDRTGRVYERIVEPDVAVIGDERLDDPAADAAVRAAIAWLEDG